MPKTCTGWCPPTILYLGLVAVSLVLSLTERDPSVRFSSLLSRGITGLLWTAVLYGLCYYCYDRVAWFIFLLPFILGLILLVFASTLILTVLKPKREHFKTQFESVDEEKTDSEEDKPEAIAPREPQMESKEDQVLENTEDDLKEGFMVITNVLSNKKVKPGDGVCAFGNNASQYIGGVKHTKPYNPTNNHWGRA